MVLCYMDGFLEKQECIHVCFGKTTKSSKKGMLVLMVYLASIDLQLGFTDILQPIKRKK